MTLLTLTESVIGIEIEGIGIENTVIESVKRKETEIETETETETETEIETEIGTEIETETEIVIGEIETRHAEVRQEIPIWARSMLAESPKIPLLRI